MDAAELKTELLRLLTEDREVIAAVHAAVETVDELVLKDAQAAMAEERQGPVAKAVQAVKAKVVPPWLQR